MAKDPEIILLLQVHIYPLVLYPRLCRLLVTCAFQCIMKLIQLAIKVVYNCKGQIEQIKIKVFDWWELGAYWLFYVLFLFFLFFFLFPRPLPVHWSFYIFVKQFAINVFSHFTSKGRGSRNHWSCCWRLIKGVKIHTLPVPFLPRTSEKRMW